MSASETLRDCGHWRDVVALRTSDGGGQRTMSDSEVPREVVTKGERVDLAAALDQLDGNVVRVDSGGRLNGALLQAGLVDELSLLVHPLVVGADATRWYGAATGITLELLGAEQLEGGLTWLRYRIERGGAT